MIAMTLSPGPVLDKTLDVGVHIIKLPPKEAIAESMGPKPSAGALLAEAAKHAGSPRKTDVVVYDHQPWHVVNGQLKQHPQVHIDDPETILRISFSARERAVWWSEQPFRITSVRRSNHHPVVAGSPCDNPFDGPPPPHDARPEPDLPGHTTVYVVRTQPIVKAAVGQMYKVTFFVDDEIDPDMEGAP